MWLCSPTARYFGIIAATGCCTLCGALCLVVMACTISAMMLVNIKSRVVEREWFMVSITVLLLS